MSLSRSSARALRAASNQLSQTTGQNVAKRGISVLSRVAPRAALTVTASRATVSQRQAFASYSHDRAPERESNRARERRWKRWSIMLIHLPGRARDQEPRIRWCQGDCVRARRLAIGQTPRVSARCLRLHDDRWSSVSLPLVELELTFRLFLYLLPSYTPTLLHSYTASVRPQHGVVAFHSSPLSQVLQKRHTRHDRLRVPGTWSIPQRSRQWPQRHCRCSQRR